MNQGATGDVDHKACQPIQIVGREEQKSTVEKFKGNVKQQVPYRPAKVSTHGLSDLISRHRVKRLHRFIDGTNDNGKSKHGTNRQNRNQSVTIVAKTQWKPIKSIPTNCYGDRGNDQEKTDR